ncbi:helix-turn-helix domain-containing protein [Amycolatopsis sp. cmx-11-32]|uniref:helix-turn-helix domain-containing protein n=1 Tax=Amycolatopsis sp. cmx-11-32 TaxID=2785796 RepID=UPI0039E52269
MNTRKDKYFSTVKRRELGFELRRIRERSGYLAFNMSTMLGWNASSISRLENGLCKAQDGRVALYLARAKATTDELDRLIALDRSPDDGYQVRPHPTGFPDALLLIAMLDAESSSFTTYDATGVPRHLQVEPYIRAALAHHGHMDGPVLDAAIQDRLTRQPSDSRKPGPFTFYIPEAAFPRKPENPAVIHEQLVHLVLLSSFPRCHLHLVPAAAVVADLSSGFTVYRHDEHPPVVHHQHPTASVFLENAHDVAYYESHLERLAKRALDRQKSRELLCRKLADMERRLEHDRHEKAQRGNGALQDRVTA